MAVSIDVGCAEALIGIVGRHEDPRPVSRVGILRGDDEVIDALHRRENELRPPFRDDLSDSVALNAFRVITPRYVTNEHGGGPGGAGRIHRLDPEEVNTVRARVVLLCKEIHQVVPIDVEARKCMDAPRQGDLSPRTSQGRTRIDIDEWTRGDVKIAVAVHVRETESERTNMRIGNRVVRPGIRARALASLVSIEISRRLVPVADADDVEVAVVVDVTGLRAVAALVLDNKLLPARPLAVVEQQPEAAML